MKSIYRKKIIFICLNIAIFASCSSLSVAADCPAIKDKTQLINHSNFKTPAYLTGNPSVKREIICTTINRLSKKICNKTLFDKRMEAPKGSQNYYGPEFVAWKECNVACNVQKGNCLRAPLKELTKY